MIISINSDTTLAQTIALGSTGTDANIIDSGTGTHTIHLPTASATARGLLSSANWSTFNGKQDALTFGIANTNKIQIDAADVADNDYAKFTASGLEGRSYSEVLSDIGAEPIKGADDNYVTDAEKISIGTIGDKLPLAGGTLTGVINLGENAGLVLDTLLSDDGKYSGIIEIGVAGATIVFGDLCYLDPTDSRWELTDANVITSADGDCRGTLGICVLAGNDGDATKMLLWGKVRAAAFPTFTINEKLFVSETAGDITHTQPTTTDVAIRVVGVALTAEDMLFHPSPDYITHA
jgi:hypothetical protein